MGCPMKEAGHQKAEATSEYPFMSIYRPWSWVLSSFFNIFIFIALVGLAYYYIRRRRSNKGKPSFNYRTIQVNKEVKEEKKVALVTGGNGALGKEIVKSLLNQNEYAVQSLDILLPDENNINGAVSTYVQADITNLDELLVAFKNVDVVFHCAAITPLSVRYSKEDYFRINLTGTENAISACTTCGVKRLIYTSSASVTLSKDANVISSNCDESYPLPDDPLNPYIASKGEADKRVRAANGNNGLLTCVLRPNVFVHTMVAVIKKNLYCLDGGNFEVSLVSVESVADAHVLADKKLREEGNESLVAGKAYNVSDQKVSMDEFTKFVGSQMNIPTKLIPVSLVRFLAWLNEFVYKWTGLIAIDESLTTMNLNMKSHTYTSDLARQELGWGPSPPWEEVVRGLLKTNEENKKDN